MLKPYKQTKTQYKAKNTNLVDGVELVRVVEGPPPVGGGRVGVNFAVNLEKIVTKSQPGINLCILESESPPTNQPNHQGVNLYHRK